MSTTRVQLGEGGGTVTQPDSTSASVGDDGKIATRENNPSQVNSEEARKELEAKEAAKKAGEGGEGGEGQNPAEGTQSGDDGQAPDEGDTPDEGGQNEGDDPLAEYTAEFTEKGELSPESVKKAAEQFGVPEDVVKAYVDGLKAQQTLNQSSTDQVVTSIHGEFGGAEEYGKFQEWANANLKPSQHSLFNKLLDTDPEGALEYARELKAKYAAAGNQTRRDITKNQSSKASTAVQGYKSTAEMKAAMNDPRYKTDPAYRAEVEAKVGAM